MNLLSALMPGLRDFRVPFAVGLLWLTALILVAYPYREQLAENPAIANATAIYSAVPQSLQFGAATFAAYALGLVANSLTRDVSSQVGARWRAVVFAKAEANLRGLWVLIWTGWAWLYPTMSGTDVLTHKIVSQTLGPHNDPAIGALIPETLIHAEFELAALRLSKDAPDQFQQYDRLVAEADFKKGLALPIFALTMALGLTGGSWAWLGITLLVGTLLTLYLSAQGHRQRLDADKHIMTAMSLSWTSTPSLTAIRERLDVEEESPTTPELGKFGAKAVITIAIVTEALRGRALRTYWSKLLHPSRRDVIEGLPDMARLEIEGMFEAYHRQLEFMAALEKER